MSQAAAIEERVGASEPGTLFVPSDFSDLAGPDSVSQQLSRMARRGELTRAARGVYAKPRRSELLGVEVPPSPDEVAHAIARSNRWVIAPAGDTALNRLGLDTQVPATYEYVSSGPYKSYDYGRFLPSRCPPKDYGSRRPECRAEAGRPGCAAPCPCGGLPVRDAPMGRAEARGTTGPAPHGADGPRLGACGGAGSPSTDGGRGGPS